MNMFIHDPWDTPFACSMLFGQLRAPFHVKDLSNELRLSTARKTIFS